jgi:hypothetical protein
MLPAATNKVTHTVESVILNIVEVRGGYGKYPVITVCGMAHQTLPALN